MKIKRFEELECWQEARKSKNPSNPITQVTHLIRYRFFLFAGILPYILGSVIAFHSTGTFYLHYFLLGLLGIALVLVGVETFNEFFDSKTGTDRIFSNTSCEVPGYIFKIGISAFSFAFFIAITLSLMRGWLIIIFALSGFLAAAFYVAPPFRWAYKGLGELVIALSYGPFMTVGSYYLQAQQIDSTSLIASLILGLFILALALVNEIPDYFQDKLVGKRNIVVRIGRKNTTTLYGVVLLSCFTLVALGLISKELPFFSVSIFLISPLAYKVVLIARRHYDYPLELVPAIRGSIFLYIAVVSLLIVSYLA